MLLIPPEEKALLEHHLTESARIMLKYTEQEKQKDFETHIPQVAQEIK